MTQHPHRVVVLGAGYAGLLATARLAGRMKREVAHGRVAITLVNTADVFVERLRLHQLAANRLIEQRPIASILQGAGVTFVRGTVTRIDVARRSVDIQTGSGVQSQEYDYLIRAGQHDRPRQRARRARARVCPDAGGAALRARSARDLIGTACGRARAGMWRRRDWHRGCC
jgi:NADH:ubiquinone reductase (H+-translocating)